MGRSRRFENAGSRLHANRRRSHDSVAACRQLWTVLLVNLAGKQSEQQMENDNYLAAVHIHCCPVTWRALGEDRKTSMSAISSGCCQTPRGQQDGCTTLPQLLQNVVKVHQSVAVVDRKAKAREQRDSEDPSRPKLLVIGCVVQ